MPGTRPLPVTALLVVVVVPVLAPVPAPPIGDAAGLPESRQATDGTADARSPIGTASLPDRDRPPPSPGTASARADCPSSGSASAGSIRSVYPNPVADGDAGEFVVVDLPDETNLSGWTLADDETDAPLPDRTVSGAVAASTAPAVARNLTALQVVEIGGALSLSNAGETLTLACDGTAVDSLAYGRASEAERWNGTEWRPLGATSHRPAVVENATVRAFALPDAPAVPVETLRGADRRLLLGGYTFASERVADALRAAAGRGVRVRVLLEGGPVGGIDRRQARVLDDLARSGVEVRVLTGPYARYAYHHPKYAVVDDRVLVTSENWKPSGTGGRGSRGWGVVVRDAAMADAAATVFGRDADWRAATPWLAYRANRSFQPAAPPNGTLPSRFRPRTLRAERIRLLVAPENAESGVVDLLRSADDSIAVEQVSAEPGSPFVRETVAAARRGVDVRVLLDGSWYVREENARLVDRLNGLAADEGLPISARLVDPGSRFDKIHVKGVVVDGERVVVGSLNWNNHSARENREVVVVLEGEAVGAYYSRLFRADWRSGAWQLPAGMVVALAGAVALAAVVARRTIRFDGEAGEPTGGPEVAVGPRDRVGPR